MNFSGACWVGCAEAEAVPAPDDAGALDFALFSFPLHAASKLTARQAAMPTAKPFLVFCKLFCKLFIP